MSTESEFNTDDLYCAAFLLTQGISLLRTENLADRRRKVFVFPASAREKAALFYSDAPAPARSFTRAMNDLRALTKFNPS